MTINDYAKLPEKDRELMRNIARLLYEHPESRNKIKAIIEAPEWPLSDSQEE